MNVVKIIMVYKKLMEFISVLENIAIVNPEYKFITNLSTGYLPRF